MDSVQVGWCFERDESSAAFHPPQPLSELIERQKKDAGVGACPATRDFDSRVFVIKSPYTFKLRACRNQDNVTFHPIYPFTQIDDQLIKKLIQFQPKSLWRDQKYPVLQLVLPYVFVADKPVIINQLEPTRVLMKKNWSLIQGRFDIRAWQRPINWAIEWTNLDEDLTVRRGQPLFQLLFETEQLNTKINLSQVHRSESIARAIESTKNITRTIRGTSNLIKNLSEQERENLL